MIRESETIMYFVTLEATTITFYPQCSCTVFLATAFCTMPLLKVPSVYEAQCPGLNSAHNSDVFNLISITTFNLSQPMKILNPIQRA